MLAKLLREFLLTGATLLLLAGAVLLYDRAVGGTLVPEDALPDLRGLDRRWVLGAIAVGISGSLLVLFRRPPTAAPVRRGCAPWILALAVIAGCACGIAALYHAPDEIHITDTLVLRKMSRESFLRSLAWIASGIGAMHVLLFLAFALRSRRSVRPPRRGATGGRT